MPSSMLKKSPECIEDPSYITTESLSSRFSLSDLSEVESDEEAVEVEGEDVECEGECESDESEEGIGEGEGPD